MSLERRVANAIRLKSGLSGLFNPMQEETDAVMAVIREELGELHTKYPIYPVAQGYHDANENCPHCEQRIEDSYGPGSVHDEADEGQLVLCFTKGPDRHVCEHCYTISSQDEDAWPCPTMKLVEGEQIQTMVHCVLCASGEHEASAHVEES